MKRSTEVFPYESFRHSETIFFRRKIVIPPFVIHNLFRCRKFSETQDNGVPLREFSALWYRRLSTEKFDTPPPLFRNLIGYRKFSETQHKRFPVPKFSALWYKLFSTEYRDTHFLFHNLFRCRKFSETQQKRAPL